MKKKVIMTVTDSSCLAEGIYSLTLQYPEGEAPEAGEVIPGQFAGLYPSDPSKLLMRPISICRWLPDSGELRFVYRVAGGGTSEFSRLSGGDTLAMLGILGNGYDLGLLAGKRVLLLGGGIGVPPMLELAARLAEPAGVQSPKMQSLQTQSAHEEPSELLPAATEVTAVLGYRDGNLFLKQDFAGYARVLIATEDGSIGTRGNVLDAVHGQNVEADVICACGPMPMLRAVKQYARQKNIPAYLSLEERMACGVGACLGCVTKTTHKDAHSQVNNARVCTEGPVFAAEEVEI